MILSFKFDLPCHFCFSLDLEPPVVTCPADVGDFTDPGQPTAIVTWNPATASDNSGSVASLTSNYNSNSAFDIGVTTVRYTATDDAGNIGTCSFKVTVIGRELHKINERVSSQNAIKAIRHVTYLNNY